MYLLKFKVFDKVKNSNIELRDILESLNLDDQTIWNLKTIEYNNVIVVGSKFDEIIGKYELRQPISNSELLYLVNNVSQVEDCDVSIVSPENTLLNLRCYDSTYWEVRTNSKSYCDIIKQFSGSAPDVI